MGRDYPLAALTVRRSLAKLVLTRHVLFPLKRIHKLTLRRTARVIAVSEAVARALRAQQIFDDEKITVIYHGVDVDRFEAGRAIANGRAASGNKLRVGMVGNLQAVKGHEDFIRAAAIVCAKTGAVEFVIAGDDASHTNENRLALEKLVIDLDLRDRVRLLGAIADVAELLPTFDLFVSPSRAESFGLSIAEAMAAGVPVIATKSEGALEIVQADKTGRLVPIGDVEAMARGIGELLSDPALRERLAQQAKADVRDRFSLAR